MTGNERLCRRCSDPIRPLAGDTIEDFALAQELAAWLAGYCDDGCMFAHATELVRSGRAWWQQQTEAADAGG